MPAIAASLEAVPDGRPVLVVGVVDDPESELALETPGDLTMTWVLRRPQAHDPDHLRHAVEALAFPTGTPDVFVHGEATEVRAVRKHLLGERGITAEGASISPYWRRDFTDEDWRQVKRDWLAEQEADV